MKQLWVATSTHSDGDTTLVAMATTKEGAITALDRVIREHIRSDWVVLTVVGESDGDDDEEVERDQWLDEDAVLLPLHDEHGDIL